MSTHWFFSLLRNHRRAPIVAGAGAGALHALILFPLSSHEQSGLFFLFFLLATAFTAAIAFAAASFFQRCRRTNSASLEESISFHSLAIKKSPDLYFVKDENFRIIEANYAFKSLYPPEMRDHIIGTTTVENYSTEDREQFLTQDRLAFDTGASEIVEKITFPNGETRTLHTTKHRFEDSVGRRFIFGVGRSISNTQIIQELSNANSMLSSVLQASSNAIMGLDGHGQIIFLNTTARHMLGGLSDAAPLSWPENVAFLDLDTAAPLPPEADPLRQALAGKRLVGQLALMKRAQTADPRYVRLSSSKVEDDAAHVVKTVLNIEDVSELEKNRQRVERVSRLDALGQLTGGIAHDFNNLLATIGYSAQLMKQVSAEEAPGRPTHVDRILHSVKRGSQLTTRLLAFAKRQPGAAKSQSANEILSEFARLATPTIEESIRIDFGLSDSELWVFCDPAQLENALLNLVLNSRDAIIRGGAGSRIQVSVRDVAIPDADDILRREFATSFIARGVQAENREAAARRAGLSHRFIEFSVTDDGPGMNDEVKRRSVDPFFTTKHSNSGTGLGLSMVYGFVQQSGGELRIHSQEGRGATVRMLLPRGNAGGEREAPVSMPPQRGGDGHTVLLAEDEPHLAEVMGEMLRFLGYRTLAAASGAEAMALLDRHPDIDVLLTDVVMPGGVGGFELATQARARRPGLPVVYMSGYTGYAARDMGDAVGEVLKKPCDASQLAHALDKALRGGDA